MLALGMGEEHLDEESTPLGASGRHFQRGFTKGEVGPECRCQHLIAEVSDRVKGDQEKVC